MNKRLLYTIAGIVAIVIASVFIFSRSSDIRNYPPKGDGPIVAFGDSLVEGVGATKGNDLVSLLSKKIGEPIENLGVSGNTTAEALSRVDEALKLRPRAAIVLLGGNDFLQKKPISETFANLRSIVAKFQDGGAVVLLLGVRSGLFNDEADDYYRKLADETSSAYVEDVLSGLVADSRYMSDAVHPNDAGYARIAERIYPVLARILR